ncbi:MAG: hypothetical protein M3O02_01365 [Acidobacteriota bacterium]|nr:hypothetical protein [Acidobacteriota bacterium]
MQPFPGALEHTVVIEIGGVPIALETSDPGFIGILKTRFGDFFDDRATPQFQFRMDLVPPDKFDPDADAEVWLEDGEWRMQRGDFLAEWSPERCRGTIRQSANPYSIDSVLRLVHSLLLAPAGGFLLHASSGIRNGKAFLFSGVSEAGKTTMARLAPSDVLLLTDEVSYVRKTDGGYTACGTPFAGEFGEPGQNVSAPIAALYLLEKAAENSIAPMAPAEAIRRLMRNVLFFAHDTELVRLVFASVCAFVAKVPVYRLSFFPDQRVWELIG